MAVPAVIEAFANEAALSAVITKIAAALGIELGAATGVLAALIAEIAYQGAAISLQITLLGSAADAGVTLYHPTLAASALAPGTPAPFLIPFVVTPR